MTAARIVIALAGILAAAIIGAVLFGGPVVKWYQQRTADAEATAEHATDDAAGRKLEVDGTQDITDAAGDLSAAVGQLKGAANALERQTRADPATRTAIPPGELARIREHDRSLCDAGIVRCDDSPAATAGNPEVGNGAVRSLDVAGE